MLVDSTGDDASRRVGSLTDANKGPMITSTTITAKWTVTSRRVSSDYDDSNGYEFSWFRPFEWDPGQKLTPRINYDYFVGQLLRSSLFFFHYFFSFLSFPFLFFFSSISLGLNLAASGRPLEWNLNFACKFFFLVGIDLLTIRLSGLWIEEKNKIKKHFTK